MDSGAIKNVVDLMSSASVFHRWWAFLGKNSSRCTHHSWSLSYEPGRTQSVTRCIFMWVNICSAGYTNKYILFIDWFFFYPDGISNYRMALKFTRFKKWNIYFLQVFWPPSNPDLNWQSRSFEKYFVDKLWTISIWPVLDGLSLISL